MRRKLCRTRHVLASPVALVAAALLSTRLVSAQFAGVDTSAAAEAAPVLDERALLATTNPEYVVTPGDIYTLSYRVGTSMISLSLVVDSTYSVNLEAFGIESAKGLTFVAFKSLVQDAVAKAYPASWPQVFISSVGVFEVYLKGEVSMSGYKSAWGLTRLSEVIKDALTPYSSTRDVAITTRSGATQTYDLFFSTRHGRSDQDPFVRPGDIIVVKPARRQVTISGEVRRPGQYQLLEGEQLSMLLEGYGDGFTREANRARVELEHTDASSGKQTITYLDLSRGMSVGTLLDDGDAVAVPSVAQIVPVVYFQGALVPPNAANPQERNASYRQRYRLREGETLVTALRSVDVSPQADLTGCYVSRGDQKLFVDVDALLTTYDPRRDIVLRPLDTIVIPYVR